AEYVDHVDAFGHLGQRPVDALAEELVGEGVDRDDAKAAALEAVRDGAAGLARVARGAHYRDRDGAFENLCRGARQGDSDKLASWPGIPHSYVDMAHPVVELLRFTRLEWQRGLRGVTEQDGARHVGQMNSIGWIVGHMTWHEQRTFFMRPRGELLLP